MAMMKYRDIVEWKSNGMSDDSQMTAKLHTGSVDKTGKSDEFRVQLIENKE